jgi:hypothetical protein
MCDGCQLACHGACYVRAYGQPLAAGAAAAGGGKGLDTRVLCVSCQDPELQTLQVCAVWVTEMLNAFTGCSGLRLKPRNSNRDAVSTQTTWWHALCSSAAMCWQLYVCVRPAAAAMQRQSMSQGLGCAQ